MIMLNLSDSVKKIIFLTPSEPFGNLVHGL